MKITKITIGRLYNLGNYEHVRYELTTELTDGEDAAVAVTGMERILGGLAPIKKACIKTDIELQRMADEIQKARIMPAVEWQRHYGGYVGTPSEIIQRLEQSLAEETLKARDATARARKARQLFNDLGGAAEWKDAKLDWEDYNYDDQP